MGKCCSKEAPDVRKKKKTRLKWGRRHRQWYVDDWKRVLWSNESSFELINSTKIVYVRRQAERYNEKWLPPTSKFGGGKLMI